MNRKEAAELSPFIKAFGEGRIIEFSSITDVSKAWREVTDFPIGMIKNFKFRIKPESKYRPFKDAKECWQEMQKHQPIGWITSQDGEVKSLIILIDNEGLVIGDRKNGVIGFVTATDLFKIKFADGTPFGIKEEEQLWLEIVNFAN